MRWGEVRQGEAVARDSHWILKSGGSSRMLDTAMWPVSPSSNSTTTESRSSSSSLDAPVGSEIGCG